MLRKGVGAVALVVAILGAGALAIAGALAVALVQARALAIAGTGAVALGGVVAVALSVAVAGAVAGAVASGVAGAVAIVGAVTGAAAGSVATNIAITGAVVATLVSAYIGWRAFKGDERDAWMRSVAIAFAAIGGTSFRRAILTNADFSKACLKSSDLRWATLIHTNWHNAIKLDLVRAKATILMDSAVRELLVTHRGVNKSYSGCNLNGANLIGADLSGANLTDADISQATLESAWLERSTLTRIKALGTSFCNAKLTGACLEGWNIDSKTQLVGVDCEFVYLLNNNQERRPSSEGSQFAPGEFTSLFEEALNTIDLIFRDGVDWQAFFQSFQALRNQYNDEELLIQAIEKKSDGAFVIRLEVSQDSDKASIESNAKQLYENQLKTLESQYEKQLRLQGEQHLEKIQSMIAAERQEKATLMGVLTTMAHNQGSKYDFRNAQFAGGFAETVYGNQLGGTINNEVAETPSISEIAAEIQNLVEQLKASNPTATKADQIAFLKAIIPPTQRDQFISVFQSADKAAIEKVPYGTVLKALIEGW